MARFVELTPENGSKVMMNVDMVMAFAPTGGDEARGTVISFAYSAGDKNVTRNMRVVESYDEVTNLFSID
jgi:hypothetical protein